MNPILVLLEDTMVEHVVQTTGPMEVPEVVGMVDVQVGQLLLEAQGMFTQQLPLFLLVIHPMQVIR